MFVGRHKIGGGIQGIAVGILDLLQYQLSLTMVGGRITGRLLLTARSGIPEHIERQTSPTTPSQNTINNSNNSPNHELPSLKHMMLQARPRDGRIVLSWQDPGDNACMNTFIVRVYNGTVWQRTPLQVGFDQTQLVCLAGCHNHMAVSFLSCSDTVLAMKLRINQKPASHVCSTKTQL